MESNLVSMNPSRPSTAGLIELHIYQVPEDLWNFKLNNVSTDLINKFMSVGFIRVSPEMKLRTLRERLGEFLGDDIVLDKFAFLKCVGRSLAVVKAKQEHELKLKSFAPPYATQPELYLLMGAEYEGSTYGSSIISDEPQYSPEYNSSNKSSSRLVQQSSIQSISHPISEISIKEPILSRKEKQDITSTFTRKEQDMAKSMNLLHLDEQNLNKEKHILLMGQGKMPTAASKITENGIDAKQSKGRNTTSDSGIPESLGGREPDHLQKNSLEPLLPSDSTMSRSEKRNDQFGDNSFRPLLEPAQYHAPPSPPPLPTLPTVKAPVPKAAVQKVSLTQQLNQLKDERMQMEKTREELVRKAKMLIEQYKLKRHQARNSWKKKYFERKKVTSLLEETLNTQRNDLEVYYKKLMTQLAARDSRKCSKAPALAANSKNAVIMSITTKQHELNQLKRKVENARIKLLIEIKMRKQASSELNVLKAELAQKKAQSSLNTPPVFAQ
ncbi:spermatogenesis-associated protein 1 [Xenopus laevis]|uniref:Spermatogenesis-associated protein 1 C-terminal domain-containing protein n=2 Tax=Xenopus laevis TaxID=8355 RepID=A0A974HNL9_XENLA|nr:spermatogenesis-associated protein 1 [Xenopus laevis]OCT84739.1 hypothetical protein XELAEV_18022895mg [Xenopus laevis]